MENPLNDSETASGENPDGMGHEPRPESRRALVLGGTSFVGRHVVEALLDTGWVVDVFHRGRTGDDLFTDRGVTHLHGDRDGDVDVLADAAAEHDGWEACVDVTAYTPEQVGRTAEVLADQVQHLVLVSTVSVYAVPLEAGSAEEAAVQRVPRDELTEGEAASYGPLKVLVEEAASSAYDSLSVVRPGIVAGPWDPTDRFTSWVRRFSRTGRHVVPPSERPVQWVDARDLAALVAVLAASREQVTVNAVRPPVRLSELLRTVADTADEPFDPLPLEPEEAAAVQEQHGAGSAWPMWLPEDSEHAGLAELDASLSVSVGATYRSVAATVEATLQWLREHEPEATQGLDPEEEARLLEQHVRA